MVEFAVIFFASCTVIGWAQLWAWIGRCKNAEAAVVFWKAAFDEERERNMASSLGEYTATRGQVAMPARQDEAPVRYGFDETGIVRGVIDADL